MLTTKVRITNNTFFFCNGVIGSVGENQFNFDAFINVPQNYTNICFGVDFAAQTFKRIDKKMIRFIHLCSFCLFI